MQLLHVTSLVVIAVTWLIVWRFACRWCRAWGVDERASLLGLSCIVPTAGLIFAVHLPAFVSLLTGRALVTPEPVALIFLALAWLGHRLPMPAFANCRCSSPPPSTRLGVWCVPVLIVAGMYAVFFVDALTRYPTGYDARYYHLPQAIGWMQQRALNLVEGFPFRSPPENGMMVPFLLSFAKLDRLFTVVHLPAGLLLGAVTYGLARASSVSHLGAWACVCVVLSIPMVVFQSFSCYVDLYAAEAYLAALLALTWAARARAVSQRRGLLVLAGLSAGVALGSRSMFLALVPLLGLVAMSVEWIRPRREHADRRRPVANLALFGTAALVCSAFWFVRGAVQAGNPFHPLAIRIGDKTVLPGFSADEFLLKRTVAKKFERWWDYLWRETKYSGTGYPYSVNNGVGAAYAAFVPLGILAAVFSRGTRWPRAPAQKWQLVYLLLALSGCVLLLTVFYEVLRYVLPQMLLAVPVAAVLMDRLIAKFPRSMFVALTLSLTVTAAVATLKPVHGLAGRVKDNVWDRATFYRIPPLIDELAPGTRIVNASRAFWNYPLLGDRLSNVVIDPGVWRLMLDGKPISARALRDHAIDYIYTRQPWPNDWPDDLPIEKVYDDSEEHRLEGAAATRIYRVTRAEES